MKRLLLALLLITSPASAADIELRALLPCFEPSFNESLGCYEDTVVVERGLDSLLVQGIRFGTPDTIPLGGIKVPPGGCDSVWFAAEIPTGWMGELLVWLKDMGGNLSCGPWHYVFALPLVDPVVEEHYILKWRKR